MKKTTLLITILLVVITLSLNAQSAKSFYKTGVAFAQSQDYSDAISVLNKSISLDPEYVKAYIARAAVYEQVDSLDLAMKDYKLASSLDADDEENFYHIAKLNLAMGNYQEAIIAANKALTLKRKYLDAVNVRTIALFEQEKLGEAEMSGAFAFSIKKNYDTYYNLGLVYLAQKKYAAAEQHFQLAHSKNRENIGALIAMGRTFYEQGKFDACTNVTFQALGIEPKSWDALWLRAAAYEKNQRYQDAINDLSQMMVFHPTDERINEVYLKRATIYYDFNQHMNAINDYTLVINNDSSCAEAYFGRAASYEDIRAIDNATADYEMLKSMGLVGEKYTAMLAAATARLYELKRESDNPIIQVSKPTVRNAGELEVIKGNSSVYLEGLIKDASDIKSFMVNGENVSIVKKTNGFKFTIALNVDDISEIVFVAEDVYGNNTIANYRIIRTEVDAPEVSLITPVTNDDGQIYVDSDEPILYIEGVILDESRIASIVIDSVNASYITSASNPAFSANINIANKKMIWIEVEDVYGNITRNEYIINRDAAALSKNNPMGKTWVVFIENSKYESFASLDGPTKDVTMMKAALSQYQIHHIIHKKDMSKAQMERFFSIELRDLVRKNHVNSLVVWYAGHGKFINRTGYWIPVDANRDDEFGYFNINTLKASMQSYSTVVTHTLVVTDACESGPTFYSAMRSGLKIRDCGDWQATKFKSSQVFSSAGYELASDNSQFTKTFANSLKYNPNSCIPIESVVKKVTSAVARNKQQKPLFGKIDGMADENGTFFFIKR
jgi:tetratricopeptide (TPR) repeat protein